MARVFVSGSDSALPAQRSARRCTHHHAEGGLVAGRRILVVDDEPQITRVLRTTLTSHGYEIRVANDGESALDLLKDWPADLLITDLSMPAMDGLELTRRVRTRSRMPIIVLSVRGEER